MSMGFFAAGAMGQGGGGGGDPHWANVLSLLHYDGADGSTTFTDQVSGTTWSRTSGAEIDTAQSMFGGSSGLFPDGVNSNYGRIDSNTDASFAFGTGDFTMEGFVRKSSSVSSNQMIFDTRPTGVNGAYPTLFIFNNDIQYFTASATRITGTGVISLNAWLHWALCRASGSTRLFIEGTQVGSTYADSNNYANQRFRYGNTSAADSFDNLLRGWLDECRITKGVARYTSNFTPPAAPFPNS